MGYAEFERHLLAWMLASIRLGTAFLICPALSDSMIMGLTRRVVILALSVLAMPMVEAGMPVPMESFAILIPVALKEVLVGLMIGFFGAIPFWIAENVGNFIDNQRGATMGEVYSPLSGTQVSTTGIFFTQIVSTIFFVSGAVLIFLAAIYSSFSLWPVFAAWPKFTNPMPLEMLGALDGMLRTTVVIAAPIVILMFLVTVGLGFVNRTAPQLNVFFLSMPIKSALGIAMLIIYLPFIMDMLMYTSEGQIINPVKRVLTGT